MWRSDDVVPDPIDVDGDFESCVMIVVIIMALFRQKEA
jgi:hypothetical protein